MTSHISEPRPITSYRAGVVSAAADTIVKETPLTIYVNGDEFATMVCSPEHLREMVVGFLASEGIILVYNDIFRLELDEESGFAYVHLYKKPNLSFSGHSKRFIGSCCGKSRQFYFHNDMKMAKTSRTSAQLSPSRCASLMQAMQEDSEAFHQTGGVHNAALCSTDELLLSRMDIGRHNALDKLYGHCLMHHWSVRDKVLVFSGRLSSEVLTKAAKIGVGIVLSKSAPTSLAIDLADDLNITAVGFVRGDKLNVYTHSERIFEEGVYS
ncbi:formate dehydrogenase accessory sulfurtransferase FdhD [Salibacterium halotolerans]|uniref:Sulfur carrier protein FdhD n=1 Tax=Salibacterium halotolerans TaxID=1884432 RepID=A0A1I5W421_9BACI|nr:formate dehydrogenase accessory sulfurtransferase FdhD [Salibacterium halotolerans]SFQ14016.1 FdhD protein [Salibacterium halotolerans]